MFCYSVCRTNSGGKEGNKIEMLGWGGTQHNLPLKLKRNWS